MKVTRAALLTLLAHLSMVAAANAGKAQENALALPESFKEYVPHIHGHHSVFIAPELAEKARMYGDEDDSDHLDVEVPINGHSFKILFSPGPSEDPSFIIRSSFFEEDQYIPGDLVYVSAGGNFYSSTDSNEYYKKSRKFVLSENGLKEVNQAAYLVDYECETFSVATLFQFPCGMGQKVATIPKGNTVRILVEGKEGDCSLPQYLVATSFGLVGWVGSEGGYLDRPGDPLSCLRYMGD